MGLRTKLEEDRAFCHCEGVGGEEGGKEKRPLGQKYLGGAVSRGSSRRWECKRKACWQENCSSVPLTERIVTTLRFSDRFEGEGFETISVGARSRSLPRRYFLIYYSGLQWSTRQQTLINQIIENRNPRSRMILARLIIYCHPPFQE